jgi:hypothetical protein
MVCAENTMGVAVGAGVDVDPSTGLVVCADALEAASQNPTTQKTPNAFVIQRSCRVPGR